MDKYTFPTGTTGGRIAIRDLREKTMWMRRVKRDPNVCAVVLLSDTFMNTKWGGRQRPHFKIVRFVSLGSESGQVEALPPPPQTTSQSDLPLNEVKEPSLAEEMNDEIPDFGNENAESPKEAAAPPLPNSRRNLKKSAAETGAKKSPPQRSPSNILDAG
jgi:hypothetical protein